MVSNKPIITLFWFSMGVFVFAISLNWIVMGVNNPQQMLNNLGKEMLVYTAIQMAIGFSFGIFLIIVFGHKIQKVLESKSENKS